MRACAHVLNVPARSEGVFRREGSCFSHPTGHQSKTSTAYTCDVSCQQAASRCARREDGRPTRARLHVQGMASRLKNAETSADSLSLAETQQQHDSATELGTPVLVAAGRASENPLHAPSRAGGTDARPTTHLPHIFLVRERSCAAGPQAGGAVLQGNASLHRTASSASENGPGGERRCRPLPQWQRATLSPASPLASILAHSAPVYGQFCDIS